MLSAKKRLNRKEFDRFFALGKRAHSPSLMLVYSPEASFHASAVAPKKIFKTAVSRNKFRRRIYDVFERLLREKTITGVYICIAKAPAQNADYDELKSELLSLIHKTSAIR